jgi:hypothetical protein
LDRDLVPTGCQAKCGAQALAFDLVLLGAVDIDTGMSVTVREELALAVSWLGDPMVVPAVGELIVTVGTAEATPPSSSAQRTSMAFRGT